MTCGVTLKCRIIPKKMKSGKVQVYYRADLIISILFQPEGIARWPVRVRIKVELNTGYLAVPSGWKRIEGSLKIFT